MLIYSYLYLLCLKTDDFIKFLSKVEVLTAITLALFQDVHEGKGRLHFIHCYREITGSQVNEMFIIWKSS